MFYVITRYKLLWKQQHYHPAILLTNLTSFSNLHLTAAASILHKATPQRALGHIACNRANLQQGTDHREHTPPKQAQNPDSIIPLSWALQKQTKKGARYLNRIFLKKHLTRGGAGQRHRDTRYRRHCPFNLSSLRQTNVVKLMPL